MKRFSNVLVLVGGMWLAATVPMAQAAPCLIVTLTGTQSGPSVFNGQAGAGTLVRYGDDSNDCAAMKLQFDAGRGTNMRLSQIDVTPVQLNAIFFTHMHGDHTEGFCRHHDAALVPEGAKDRHSLQFRCNIRSGGHEQVPKICHAYCRCIPPVRRDRRAPLRGQRASRRRPSRFDQCDHIRSEGRAAGRLVVR